MSKKSENIFRWKDGRWEAHRVQGYTIPGKIVYRFFHGKPRQEAKFKAFGERLEAYGQSVLEEKCNRLSFADLCEEWLESKRNCVSDSSYVKYENTLRRHILPGFGEKPLSAIHTESIERFKEGLLREGRLSPKTVKDILMELRAILKYATARFPGAVQNAEVSYPKVNLGEIRVLSVEEQRRLIEYLKTDMDNCKFGTLLALLTGLRIGELCALRWGNISFSSQTIRIETTMQRLRDLDGADARKTKVVIGKPKSDNSARLIPMSESVLALCLTLPPMPAESYILTGTEKFMEPRALQRYIKKYASDCNLEGVHFHTLRHTFATRCVEADFELKSLSEILGHANTTITLERYVHSSLELKRKNMNKLSELGF